jgi:hypothetical protein
MEQEVINTLVDVRDWAECIAEKECYSSDLNGLCAIASAELFKRLKKKGFHPVICMSAEDWGMHVYLKLGDHVLDVTATQFQPFRNEPILIRHEKEMENQEYYRNPKVFKTSVGLRKHQLNTGWPTSQVARP